MRLYFNLAVCIIGVILTLSLGPSASTSDSNLAHFATGTVLFHNKRCWQHEDLALLSSRKTVQNLIPTNELDVSNDGYITNVIDYFRMCFSTTQKMSSGRSQDILLLALADAIGGYLHYYVLPVTKESFYCGNIRYDSATKLFSFYEDIKAHLDTNGKRWATPMDTSKMDIETRALTVAPQSQDQDPCAALLLNDKPNRDSRECSSATKSSPIPMPFMDDAEAPTSIAVPFRESNLMPLTSPRAAFVLEKYYVAGVQCLMSRGGEDSREDLAAFDTHLYRWLEQTVVPLLKDDKWYPAFGGVRKILKTIKSSGHGDASMDSEMPSTSGQKGASLDSDVHDEVDAGNGGQGSLMLWGWLVAVGFGTLTAWIAMALLCTFMRCRRGRQEGGDKGSGHGDGQYQLINTFVQIFYDMRDCGKKTDAIAHNDSGGPVRRLSTIWKDRRQSKTDSENHHSSPTSTPDRRQSVARSNASNPAIDLEDEGEDQRTEDEDHDNEHSPLIKKTEGRRRTGSIFGRSRVNSTMIEQVQTRQSGSGSSRHKNQRTKKTASPSLPRKDSKGTLPPSTDSSRTYSGSSNKQTTSSEMAYNSDSSEVSTSASENELFTRNASR